MKSSDRPITRTYFATESDGAPRDETLGVFGRGRAPTQWIRHVRRGGDAPSEISSFCTLKKSFMGPGHGTRS